MNKLTLLTLSLFIMLFSACSTRGTRTYTDYDSSRTKTYSSDKSNYSSGIDQKNVFSSNHETICNKRYTLPSDSRECW